MFWWQSLVKKICNLFRALDIAALYWGMAATNRNGLIRLERSLHWTNLSLSFVSTASTIQCICFEPVDNDQLLFLQHCGLTKIEKHFILRRSTYAEYGTEGLTLISCLWGNKHTQRDRDRESFSKRRNFSQYLCLCWGCQGHTSLVPPLALTLRGSFCH